MESILSFIGVHFLETLVLVLIVALFFKETLAPWINSKLGIEPSNDLARNAVKLQNSMDDLKIHFNDETTRLLTEIQVNMREGFKELNRKCDDMLDNFREIDKYGVKVQK